ncbi:probable pectinesterase 53 isoform X3 [Physcomitrium patens]|uniref:Pectinesterase n=1 Tax=Physcomitrium patens TaxID=3218 RepID=A0A7I4A157_PHYPA|nr:probable pectinesterase 53 isoform X2 [Physcomitrium patens]|eukprot:XP_024386057.1 probable pectinesterase 53 isoform X2 [Physcomitrella patens]
MLQPTISSWLASMGLLRRKLMLLLLLVAFTFAAVIADASGEDDNVDTWLKFMAETSGSDADPDYDAETDGTPASGSHYENSFVTERDNHTPDGTKSEATANGMFVKFPKPKGKSRKITVSKFGKDDFITINAALDSIAEHERHRTVIHIREGVYEEKIVINASKPYITFRGDGLDKTIIQWGDQAGDFDDDDQMLKTYRSATVGVSSQYFIAENIQFRNTAPQPPPGAVLRQAVALRITGDRAAFYNCAFYGFQDTLYDHKGRHYFENCYIQGSIDFVFGNGRSLYKNCHLHSEAKVFGSVTAQKRNESHMNTGFSFVDASITGRGPIYLGRAWGNFSRTVFSYTWMDNIVYPPGWSDFGFADRQKKVFYAQYNCRGPGAYSKERVAWVRELTAEEAKPFLSVHFINGKTWLKKFLGKSKKSKRH